MSLSDREKAMQDYPDEFDDFDTGDDEDEEYFDCAMDRPGACGKAGSEECEFECPYRAEEREAENRRAAKLAAKGGR